jgi:hypothetical protein
VLHKLIGLIQVMQIDSSSKRVCAYLATPLYSETPLEKPLLLRLRVVRYPSLVMRFIFSLSCSYDSSCIKLSHR